MIMGGINACMLLKPACLQNDVQLSKQNEGPFCKRSKTKILKSTFSVPGGKKSFGVGLLDKMRGPNAFGGVPNEMERV